MVCYVEIGSKDGCIVLGTHTLKHSWSPVSHNMKGAHTHDVGLTEMAGDGRQLVTTIQKQHGSVHLMPSPGE